MKQLKLFSHRKGLKPFSEVVQTDSLSRGSINHIWDALCACVFSKIADPRFDDSPFRSSMAAHFTVHNRMLGPTLESIWTDWFEAPADTIPNDYNSFYNQLREQFFKFKYSDIYDLLSS